MSEPTTSEERIAELEAIQEKLVTLGEATNSTIQAILVTIEAMTKTQRDLFEIIKMIRPQT